MLKKRKPIEAGASEKKKETFINMETTNRQFKDRFEQIEWYAKQRGWEPLTEEDKEALDDAVRMITNLD